jgi:hypothetical protein
MVSFYGNPTRWERDGKYRLILGNPPREVQQLLTGAVPTVADAGSGPASGELLH